MKKIKKKLKKILENFILLLKEEYKFFLFCIFLILFMLYPLDYYILMSGGIRNINKSIEIEDSYKEKGSFNICYVSQLDATPITYLLSYIIPSWQREKVSDYQIGEDESISDIEFRDELDLKTANNNAKYWGFTLAGEKVTESDPKIYVIYVYKEYNVDLKVGDQIISVNDEEIKNIKDFSNKIDKYNYGDYVNIKIIRNKKEYIKKCKINKNKDKKVLGIAVQYYSTYKTDKDIKFKFKSKEKGPSGGLMTTLEIYNNLTKKDYTHGLKIAGTGTIEMDGTIGAIGGVDYKVKGAAKKHADLFFVPKDNYKECMKTVKENDLDIKVVKVETIEDAVNYLKKEVD